MAELLLATHDSYQNWSVCAWNYRNGNVQNIYKNGGSIVGNTLHQLSNDYILGAERGKPLLHLWPVNSQEPMKSIKCILSDPATAVAVDPTSCYLVVGINSKLYIWHLNSGKLLNILQKHYLSVTCIKFSNSSEYLVSGGEDGMLVTYKFNDVITMEDNYLTQSEIGNCEPLYCKMDNSLPIQDICLGNFGSKSRLTTASLDNTSRIYNLHSGDLLLILTFNNPLTSLIFDSPCWNLFVGDNNGLISAINLKNPPRTVEHHIDSNQLNARFTGHQKKVTSLSLNISDSILASGSDDCNIIIWDIKTRNILKKIERGGPVTNVKFVLDHENMHKQIFKPHVIVKTLQTGIDSNNFAITIVQDEDITFNDEEREVKNYIDESSCELETKLNEAKAVNQQLYNAIIQISRKYNKVN